MNFRDSFVDRTRSKNKKPVNKINDQVTDGEDSRRSQTPIMLNIGDIENHKITPGIASVKGSVDVSPKDNAIGEQSHAFSEQQNLHTREANMNTVYFGKTLDNYLGSPNAAG